MSLHPQPTVTPHLSTYTNKYIDALTPLDNNARQKVRQVVSWN